MGHRQVPKPATRHIWLVTYPNVYGNKYVAYANEDEAERNADKTPMSIDRLATVEKVELK